MGQRLDHSCEGKLCVRGFLAGILLVLLAVSCGSERETGALFRNTQAALVQICWNGQEDAARNGTCMVAAGFFVSPQGQVLTAAHQIPTTHPVVLVYETGGGAFGIVKAAVSKTDTELDLALLDPVRPISPLKFLQLNLERPPSPGDHVAILVLFRRIDKRSGEYYPVPGVLPATVFAILRDGLFATDVYAFTGFSGSPVIDVSSGRVIGVSIGRNRQIETVEDRWIHLPREGTTVSLPVPYLVTNYAVVRSTFSAREFLGDLR